MKLKGLFIVLLLHISYWGMTQDSLGYAWKEVRTFKLDSLDEWAVDNLGNIYISKETAITKYDSAGVLKFSQSIKSFGRMKQLVPINSMKLVHFSEEQQTFCYLDNTLSPSEDCLELSDLDIINASLVASSSRSDVMWVYDNVNSKLRLIPLEGGQQLAQEITNVKGLLELNGVDQIIEADNDLYLLDTTKGVYHLDFYGNLLDFDELNGVKQICGNRKNKRVLYLLTDNHFKIRVYRPKLDTFEYGEYVLPVDDVVEFAVVDSIIYLRTKKNVHKFILQFPK